ncbi:MULTISPECIES: DUF4097 family beta strand repeat-containing protein [unclassified Streptomyces]|uniref:DUF4097 family beta strand repeat-containing protein n=1 Tax=unclassified Streptomyces TaxID=2593676 RepID=UPI0004C178A7|nr:MULTISPECIES: DUF4097 family beta strand repeat-containing protein [unclassified Streptomyces]KOV89452.1 hypothetical protein ADL04_37910 [Streptomyces sp. NRRL B-3648]
MTHLKIDRPRRMTLEGVAAIRSFIARGRIQVIGTDDDNVTLDVSEIDQHPISVQHQDGLLLLGHHGTGMQQLVRGRLRHRPPQHAVIYLAVPRDCALDLWSVSADVLAGGSRGEVQVHNGEGETTLDRLSGAVEVETSSGHVDAIDLSGDVEIRSVSGTVALYATPRRTRALKLSSVSGDISICLPETADARVHLESVNGRVSSQFEGIVPVKMPGHHKAKGDIGSGSASIWASSVSGRVVLLNGGRLDDTESTGIAD